MKTSYLGRYLLSLTEDQGGTITITPVPGNLYTSTPPEQWASFGIAPLDVVNALSHCLAHNLWCHAFGDAKIKIIELRLPRQAVFALYKLEPEVAHA